MEMRTIGVQLLHSQSVGTGLWYTALTLGEMIQIKKAIDKIWMEHSISDFTPDRHVILQ